MNPAIWLTLSRILTVPILVVLLSIQILPNQNIFNFFIFLLIFSTDYFDGMLARKFNWTTNIGKLLDPIADKILVTAVLLFYISDNKIAHYIVTIILIREFAVLGLRLIAALNNTVIKANFLGKLKTFWQFITISCLILNLPYYDYFIYIMLLLTILSGIVYFIENKEVFIDG